MINQSYKRQIETSLELALSSFLEEEIRLSKKEYDSLTQGYATFFKVIFDYFQGNLESPNFSEIRHIFFQILIIIYREAYRKDPQVAHYLLDGFITGYPNLPNTGLISKYCSLGNASIACRESIKSENKLLVWQQSCRQVQAYNEFLNGLLAYLIILWRAAKNKSIKTTVFSASYSNKLEQFKTLTGGDNGAFYLIFRLAQPKLRNAIAHETIWLDSPANKVRYIDGKQPKEFEINLADFLALASTGSHLLQPYLAAISSIAIIECASEHEKSLLPDNIIELFNFIPGQNL
ncbi:MAG: hypothetical protein HC799_16285 [Limnothrix sp. RL_2_0]|nr:hypothetical protein [Limnothrix sp. RL_2_0]